MDLQRKVEVAAQAVRSISQHDDEDLAVRASALSRLEDVISEERAAMQKRVDARIAETFGKKPTAEQTED